VNGPGQNSIGVVKTEIVRLELPPGGFRLECGKTLPELHVAFETYGSKSSSVDNVVFLCHALSGSAHAAGRHEPPDDSAPWWDNMIGPGRGIDTDYYHVICANILGGCKGTTGPSSIDPATGRPYGSGFPPITVGDMVEVHALLLKHLGIRHLAAVIGGSLGGMQALEWAIRFPGMMDRCICIAAGPSMSAQALAFDVVGRSAITDDPNWAGGDYYGTGKTPDAGLALARKIGHITYLSQEMMDIKFGREKTVRDENFQVANYLQHQGDKFVKRFDANSYLCITRAIDEFDLEKKYNSLEKAFAPVKSRVLVVAMSADWLFLPEQSRDLAGALVRAGKRVSYCEINAPHGHDAFLVEDERLAGSIRAFLPWVREDAPDPAEARRRAAAVSPSPGTAFRTGRREYDIIRDMTAPGSRVLDLGCGGGELLSLLSETRSVSGIGMDINFAHVTQAMDAGHDVFQSDIDAGLAMIPDNAYDYAILGETLQVVHKPRFVLHEMLRVAGEGILTFPNFGNWRHLAQLLAKGRMPKGSSLPFEWHETPNIHLFTLGDFICLCREDGIEILQVVCIPAGIFSRLLITAGMENLGAERVLVRITRKRQGG